LCLTSSLSGGWCFFVAGKKGGVVSRTLQPECVEGLLSYARLLFAQPQAGKLSILLAAGQQVQTVTSWDPDEQSVEAVSGLKTQDHGINHFQDYAFID
jgi:hypothetical protein